MVKESNLPRWFWRPSRLALEHYHAYYRKLAPDAGLEPTTCKLTAYCSTIELIRIKEIYFFSFLVVAREGLGTQSRMIFLLSFSSLTISLHVASSTFLGLLAKTLLTFQSLDALSIDLLGQKCIIDIDILDWVVGRCKHLIAL